jgi:serine/threonine protein kinase/Flp pilus assembly protein TadD
MSSGAADLNLLFGIMAVQNDFVSRDALIEAMGAWVLDKSKTLGEILVDRGALTSEHHALLTSLVAAHVRLHHDDPQQSLASVASASSIRQQLNRIADADVQASLAVLGSVAGSGDPALKGNARVGAGSPDPAPDPDGTTPDLGHFAGMRYRILRPHAKGGLGEVLVAEDVELHREVALKEIQRVHAHDAVSRGRFLLEAEVTGRLEHPGIVPVYGLGQYADGRPFYAMRFIHGDNLKEAIRRFHEVEKPGRDAGERRLALRQLLGRFVDVCNAVAYAHSRGVLHRDLKPGNIMLGKYGETLVVDWGLAKSVGSRQNAEGSEEVTEATLRPSSGSGVAATEMGSAIGTPAYMSPEQAAGQLDKLGPATDIYSLGATLYTLLTGRTPFEGEIDRGRVLQKVQHGDFPAPRKLISDLPRALDAVCLKAMAVKPEDRYPNTRALAADIEHWMADEPVTAYREPLPPRAQRWARHHKPLVAGLTALLAALLVLGGGGATWLYQQHAAAEREARASLEEARQALADEQYPRAQAAAERAAGRLAGGGSSALRQQAEQLLADVSMVRRMEDARLAGAATIDGQYDFKSRDRALTLAFAEYGLDVETADADEVVQRIAGSAVRAQLVAALDDWASTRAQADQSAQRLRSLANRADGDPWRARLRDLLEQKDLAALEAMVREEDALKQPPATLYMLGRALYDNGAGPAAAAMLARAQERFPGDFWINETLGVVLCELQPPQPDEAARYLTAALALHNDSTLAYVNLGKALHDKRDLDGAIRCFRRALEIDPKNPDAHNGLGAGLYARKDLDGALRCFRTALELDHKFALAHNNLGLALRPKGDLDGAVRCFRTAIELNPKYDGAYSNLGNALYFRKDLGGAIRWYNAAIKINPNNAGAQTNLGAVLRDKNDLDGAIRCHRIAIEINPKLGEAHNNLGDALRDKGDLPGAIRSHRTAIEIDPKFVAAHNNLGMDLKKAGDLDGAIRCYRTAIEFDTKYAAAHINLGNALFAKGDLEEAIRSYRTAIEIDPELGRAHGALGQALIAQGDFAEARTATQRALQLLPKDPLYPLVSQQLQTCENFLALDSKLTAVLKGEAIPAAADEQLGLAKLCQEHKKLYAAAARFFADAFASEPKRAEDLRIQARYNAACVAALAGCGQGKDTAKLDDKERTRLRRQALIWLRADLKQYAQLVDKNDNKARVLVQERMQHWQQDTDFTGVRGDALAKLPEAERQEWQKLWDDVEAMRKHAAEKE